MTPSPLLDGSLPIALFLLALTLTTPTVGSEAMSLKRTRERIQSLMGTLTPEATSLLLKRQQDEESALAKALKGFPGIETLTTLLRKQQVPRRQPRTRLSSATTRSNLHCPSLPSFQKTCSG